MPLLSESILRRKYPGALDRFTEPGHTFKRFLRLWVKDKDCPGDDNDGEYCQDEEVKEEYLKTRAYTRQHLELLKDPENNELSKDMETVPMRFDEYLVEYARELNARLQ
ncbi:unnamed protein product [Ambrosiozyma monospora]|uniref:Unnamed protein product n=1 Tax=Ambrosiozyma monospora TaxID=43982 RepID=A0ACB5SRP2_AMBMO|nr:unnamed protein product [Ambrosiozyma monospora]